MENKEVKCQLCERKVEQTYKHHLVPVSKGGRNGNTITVCATCVDMIHKLHTNKELAEEYNTLKKLKSSPKIKKYVEWIKNKPNERYKVARKKRKNYKR